MVRKSVWGNGVALTLYTAGFWGLLRKPGWFFSWKITFLIDDLRQKENLKVLRQVLGTLHLGMWWPKQSWLRHVYNSWQPIPWSHRLMIEEPADSCSQSSDPLKRARYWKQILPSSSKTPWCYLKWCLIDSQQSQPIPLLSHERKGPAQTSMRSHLTAVTKGTLSSV